ncbi:ulp1 protease family, C-terminal catalytic domain-containing protein [Tanacetum coccineum]
MELSTCNIGMSTKPKPNHSRVLLTMGAYHIRALLAESASFTLQERALRSKKKKKTVSIALTVVRLLGNQRETREEIGIRALSYRELGCIRQLKGLSWLSGKVASWSNLEGNSVQWLCIVCIDQKVLPVPPPPVRPYVMMDTSAQSEASFSLHFLDVEIIRYGGNLKRLERNRAPAHMISKVALLLQFLVAKLIELCLNMCIGCHDGNMFEKDDDGVKDKPQVGRVSPKKSKVIGSDSPRKKWVTRDMIASTKHAVKVVNAQPASEFNPITGVQVVNKYIDVVVADNTKLGKNPVVADKDDVIKKTVVSDKDDVVKKPVVADKDDVVKKPVIADKAPTTVVVSVKVPVVKKSVKASSVVADKPSSVVADKVDVVKDNINVVADKVAKENVLSVVADKASNINVVAVADKASDALKNKPAEKGKKPIVGKDKENFHDCGIFTMLHMETFNGGPASNLDCGLLVESQLQRDMLRRLRFKFATKILLHEINVHAGKMLELAKEFDKTDPVEKMAIIIDAFKKREERDCI